MVVQTYLNYCRCAGSPLPHCTFSNILLTSLNFLLRAETTKTQMRADVLLAVPAWPKCGNTDKRTAKTGMRGHLEGWLIWESWGLEMECRSEDSGVGAAGLGQAVQ